MTNGYSPYDRELTSCGAACLCTTLGKHSAENWPECIDADRQEAANSSLSCGDFYRPTADDLVTFNFYS